MDVTGLTVMCQGIFVANDLKTFMDERCGAALEYLESKRLPDGGFPAEKAYYRVTEKAASGRSLVS